MKKITVTRCVKKIAITYTISSLYLFQVSAQSTTHDIWLPEKKSTGTFISFGTWVTKFFLKEYYTSGVFITIESVAAVSTKNEALITWNASDLASGRIYYDVVSPVVIASGTPWVAASKYANYANSKANIRNLSASTTYYYKVYLEEVSGSKELSREFSFTTKE